MGTAEGLMHQLTELLFDLGEISLAEGAVFIDGIKIEANTNRYSFVWKKRYKPPLQRSLEKSDRTVRCVQIFCETARSNGEKDIHRGGDPAACEPLHPGGGCLCLHEGRPGFPKVSAAWDRECFRRMFFDGHRTQHSETAS